MQFVIIYFSGTGNTELIADEIKKCLERTEHTVDILSIEDERELETYDFSDKIIGFGFPVYKFSYPEIFNRYFPEIMASAKGNRYFLFSTYARFSGFAFADFARNFDKKHFKLIASHAFKAPSCGISARKPTDDYEYRSVMFFEDGISEILDSFVTDIINKADKAVRVSQPKGFLSGLKKRIVKDIEITKYPKLQIKNNLCTGCGLCAKKCPDKNLIYRDNQIEVKDAFGCLHCLRCINHCSANAITFGPLTEGDNQYTYKARDAMYSKATQGGQEEYWREFDAVVKAWRKQTIKYWLANRRKKSGI